MLPALVRRPRHRPFRIWHARRNNEMLLGIILRDLVRAPVKLVFTSAAQREHKPLTQWMLRRMDEVVTPSARSGSFLQVPYTIVRHGIDPERFYPRRTEDDRFAAAGLPGQRAVGCFGRIRTQKGTDLFVRAMIDLLPDHPAWTAVICGRATREHVGFLDALKAQVEEAGLSDRIMFLGEVPDIALWYRRVDLYVAPSRVEGFGLTPLEAMASGTAVVASDAGAHAEAIDEGVTGSVVPSGDGAALTSAIRRYLDDEALCDLHGRAGPQRVDNRYPLSAEADGLVEVYEKLWAGDR